MDRSDKQTETTEKTFWEKFWSELKLPSVVDPDFKNDRVIAEALKKHVPHGCQKSVAVEIGCAPGKWLVFLHKEMGYRVEGYEYLKAAADASIRNLELSGAAAGDFNIHAADFLEVEAPEKYDLVLSLGFVEHFTGFEDIMRRHFEIARPGGYVFVGIPRLKGINRIFAGFVDRWRKPGMLESHNLGIMEPEIFSALAGKLRARVVFAGYQGGFEPALFDTDAIIPAPLRLMMKVVLKIAGFLLGRVNNGFTSSYVIAVYEKEL